MRILLIGNFSPPYEEENLHNLTLLNRLIQDGHDCLALNIAESPIDHSESRAQNKNIVHVNNYADFLLKLIRYGFKRHVIHFLTKGYTRPGLMKLMTTAVVGRLLLTRMIITLHSEMFSMFGRLRSKMGGQQLLHLSFFLAKTIICGDKHTHEIALTHHNVRDKFKIIPLYFSVPEDIRKSEITQLKKLENKKRVLVFTNVNFPSFLFDILNNFFPECSDPDIGVAISLSEKNAVKLQRVIEENASKLSGNIVFIEPTDDHMLSIAYSKSDLVIGTLSCDGKRLFEDIAIYIKKPVRLKKGIYFPGSLSLVKYGEVADLCTCIFNMLLYKEHGEPLEPVTEDFYSKIKDIYS